MRAGRVALGVLVIVLLGMSGCCVMGIFGIPTAIVNYRGALAPVDTTPQEEVVAKETEVEETEATEEPADEAEPTPVPTAVPEDPVVEALGTLGFETREEFIEFFEMEGVEAREIATCPGEPACIRVLREKDEDDMIEPFQMTNPTEVKFDGWRASSQPSDDWDGDQTGVPPGGPWKVEGVTVRPWR